MTTTSPHPNDDPAVAPTTSRRWVELLPWIVATVLLVATVVAGPLTGVGNVGMVNADEAVAALLPADFARGQVSLVFPGNAYQGIVELPAYGALWTVFGPTTVPMQLLHHGIWVGALVVWTVIAWEVLGRAGSALSLRTRGWSLLAVAGLVAVTAPIGWPVWFRIYPGYHSGALLAGSAVLVALRSRAWRGWAAAGVLAGAAIYAQPMHAVGAVVVGVLVVQSPRAERMRAALAAAVGALVGLAPLLLWNLRNGMDTLSDGAAPSLHPEWSYLDRLRNTMSITARVAWGDPGNRAAVPDWVLVVQVVAIVGSAVLVVAGAVVLVRSARTSAPLLVALLLMLFGLSVLGSFSLDVDQRYAVAWWPALVVLVAAGAVGLQQLEYRSLRLVGSALIVVTVAANVVAVGGLAGTAFRERSQWPSATASTRDLAGDLERCDVAAVLGDYWAVYPALWGSDSEFSAQVLSGPTRLEGFVPDDWSRVGRLAILSGAEGPANAAMVPAAESVSGRSAVNWQALTHPETGTQVLVEVGAGVPAQCTSVDGLVPAG